jgi:hypothetical protein
MEIDGHFFIDDEFVRIEIPSPPQSGPDCIEFGIAHIIAYYEVED